MHDTKAKKRVLIVASVVVTVIVFTVDLFLPLGVAGGVPHVAAVLLAAQAGNRRFTFAVAGLATLLTIIAYFLSPQIGALTWQVLSNRLLAVFAIWVTAMLSDALSRADDAVVESEQRLRAVLDAVVDAVITIDWHGTIVGVNGSTVRMFGYAEDELIGQNVSTLIPSPYHEDHDSYIAHYLRTGEGHAIGIGREAVARRKNGSTFPIDLAVSQVEKLGLFTGIIRDITERKQAEARARQDERLAAIGQMVTSIAHESRNFLQRICNAVTFLQEIDQGNPEALEEVARIEVAEKGLENLLEETRQFAAPIKLDIERQSLQKIWRQAWFDVTATRNIPNARIDDTTGNLNLHCPIDAFRIGQVFRNLFENSLAACDDDVSVQIRCHDGEGTLNVAVHDNGPGLTAEQQANIFQPFFTTKSKGTGLGMVIVKRIVEAHGGEISVGDCTNGAEFLISLPQENS